MMTVLQFVKTLPALYGLRIISLFTIAPIPSHHRPAESNRHHTFLHFPFPLFSTTTFNTIQITRISGHCFVLYLRLQSKCLFQTHGSVVITRVGTLIVATIYLQLIQNRYMFRSFSVLQCSHQHCVQPVSSDVEVVGYL